MLKYEKYNPVARDRIILILILTYLGSIIAGAAAGQAVLIEIFAIWKYFFNLRACKF